MALRTARHAGEAIQGVHAFGDDLVVRTRFIPPRLPPQFLYRRRLDALLSGLTQYRLVLLRAEAGYGKTTAIASYLSHSGLPYFWYSLSDSDADPLIFLLHLIHVFRLAHPHVGERALALLAREGGATRLWAPVVDALANDLLDALSAPTVLVLDDYCVVTRAEINPIVERFIDHAPPSLHFVLTARSMPNLPGRIRWRASGELLEVGRAELAFTPDEVAALFKQRTGEQLAPESAHALVAETEGWPIAVHMLVEDIAAAPGAATGMGVTRTLADRLRRMPGPSELLFNYLAEEVFQRQPLPIQTFLAETALLRHLEPAACNLILNRADSESVLRYLEEHSLFVTREGTYRYHRLFRDFLLHHVRLSPERYQAVHNRAAMYYREQGNDEEAIHHLLAAGDYTAAADLLTTIAQPLAHSGRHHTLVGWLDQLPESLLEAHPELLMARGDAYRFASRYHASLAAYTRAQRCFEARADPIGEARALRGQALIYLDTVQPAQAEPLLRRALNKVRRTAKDERIQLLILLAENKINAGQLRQAERLHRAVYRLAGRDDIPTMDPRVYVRDGRFTLARQIVETNLRTDPWGAGQWRAPRSHREATVLLAWIDAMTGQAESARRYAEQSLELGRILGSPIVECVSLARLGHAWLSGADFDPARARTYYSDSRLIAERIGVPRFKVEALLGLTLIAGLEGKIAEAEAHASEALAILERAGDQYMTGVLLLALGAAATLCEHPGAIAWLTRAASLGQACGDRFGPCASDLWLALYFSRSHHPAQASAALLRALTAAHTHGYDFLFVHFPLLGPKDSITRREMFSLLKKARPDALWPYTARWLGELDVSTRTERGLLPVAAPLAWPLYIQTLGPFRVWVEGREIPRTAWGREKALHVLQFLVCQRGRLVHREQILEALWPDSPPHTAAISLRVALSALRKALASHPAPGPHTPVQYNQGDLVGVGEFIRREGEYLQLDLSAGVGVDVDEFARLLRKAKTLEGSDPDAALRHYESALALYHGDFLEENLYAEWAGEEREHALVEYLSAAERLARLWVHRGDYERGARWANAILAKDPLWEEAYVLLMECHWKQGNRALAARIFEQCSKRLREALRIEPSPRTQALFETIVRG